MTVVGNARRYKKHLRNEVLFFANFWGHVPKVNDNLMLTTKSL